MKHTILCRPTFGLVGAVVLSGLLACAASRAVADPIDPGFDLLSTPPGGAIFNPSHYPTAIPGGPDVDILMQGLPIGPSNTDTIIQRTTGLPAGGTGPIDAEIVALSLVSISPVDFGGTFFDVFVDLDPAFPSTGTINVTSHNDPPGGGLFDSFFDVFARVTLTEVGNLANQLQFSVQDQIQSTDSPWSQYAPIAYPDDPQYPAGEFYPGTVGGPPGQPVGIDHTGPHPHTDPAQNSDIVRIFDPALDPPNPSKDFVLPEPVEGAPEPFLAAFYGPVLAPDQLILFVEPDGQESDRLWIQNGYLYFESDPLEPTSTLPPTVATITENGKFQRVDQYFEHDPLAFFPRIEVFSDVEPVPEPGSVLLLLIGVVGLVSVRRRQS